MIENVGQEEFNNSCRYCRGVECFNKEQCITCGWNPFVSMQRMILRFGVGSEEFLTSFKRVVSEIDHNGIRQ